MEGNKLIATNTVILYFRLIITSVIGLFASRYIFKGLGADDFGLYSVVGSIVVMMAFINTVMISTTYRYLAFEMGRNDKVAVNKVFNISLVIHIVLAIIILLFTEIIGVYYVRNFLNINPDRVSDAVFVLRFSIYATVFSILSIPFQGLITALEKFSVRASIEILRSILSLLTAITILNFIGNRLRLYAVLMTLMTIISSLLFIVYCYIKFKDIVKWKFQKEKNKYKEMIGFSSWILIGAAASVGQRSLSAIIINSFFGTLLNAAYGIANTVNSIVSQFAGSLGQAAIPQITKNFSSGNNDRSVMLTAYISKYTVFLMLILSTPILLETKFLITLWLGEVPPYTIIMSQLIIVNTLITGLGAGLPALIQATGKIKWFQIILAGTSLLSLPIAYVLFKHGYPPYYIIITFIFTAVINVIVRQILLRKIIRFDTVFFLKTSYLRILYVSLSITPLFFLTIYFNEGMLRFISSSTLSVIYLIISIFIFGLDKKEKTKIALTINTLKIKYGKDR